MSLPYPARSLNETLVALDRLDVPFSSYVLTAWSDEAGLLHAHPHCGPYTQPTEVTAHEWVQLLDRPSKRQLACDCGGLLGTSTGSVLQVLALALQALDAARVKYRATTWTEHDAWYHLSQNPLGLQDSAATSTKKNIEGLERLTSEIAAAASAIVARSEQALDRRLLHEAIAAQGVCVTIKPSLGALLETWAADKVKAVTFQSLDQDRGAPFSRPATAPLFESALQEALANKDSRVVVLSPSSIVASRRPTVQTAVVRMLLTASGVDMSRQLVFIKLQEALADGVLSLLSDTGFATDCGPTPPSDVTLELTQRLWTPEDRGPLSRLDGALAAAKLLSN